MRGERETNHRVREYGEVLTPHHIVDAMLDLVRQQTERIDSRFLEPACGTGNFLAAILDRKLRIVRKRYLRSQLEYERYGTLAVASLYGIDLLADNVEECRRRLFELFDACYTRDYKRKVKEACREVIRYILEKNIVHGDALTLQTVGEAPRPIVFAEWSLVNGSLVKRRDFAFHELVAAAETTGPRLFESDRLHTADTGESVFIPRPVRDYPPVHFLEVFRAYS